MEFAWKWIPALVAAGTAGVAGGLMRSHYERNHFVVEETRIASPKIRQEKVLVFLSDLHDKEFGRDNRQLLDSIRYLQPDAVLIGGDTMVVKEGRAKLDVTERLLEGLRGLPSAPPVYYADGNHEQRMCWESERYQELYREFCGLLERYGIHYLQDSSECLGTDVCISGLEIDPVYYRDLKPEKMETSYLNQHLGEADSRRFQILLAHSPLFFDAYGAWGADLTLSGHFHGGTIRIPGLGGVMTPQFQFFLPWCAGTFEREGRHLIVSRGLGTHSVNIRFCNKPQVVVVRLEPQTIF